LARGAAERLSYTAAFECHIGIHPLAADVAALQKTAQERGVVAPESLGTDDRDAWLDLLLVELVEPHLGMDRPTILCDYPPSQAALAQTRQETHTVAERFELYVRGVELANGYHELLDAAVLRTRNREQNAWRRQDGKSPLPEESRLLTAMEHGLPACTGVALGFDRVVMLAAGVTSLTEVLAFPIDRA
jgi:lysyl-tRNA synthetase class 2